MATFANKSFNASSYAAFRPSYSDTRLIDTLIKYHRQGGGQLGTAVDLGCGTGQVTGHLLPFFERVIGVDPSSRMIEQARLESKTWDDPNKVEFIVSPAEDIATQVPPLSVDLVTAGEAFHWFDQNRIWSELAKAVKPGGTVAFWGYNYFRISGHPEITPLLRDFSRSPDSLGPFWEQPGINILNDQYVDLQPPDDADWDGASATRIFFEDADVDEEGLPYHPLDSSSEIPSDRNYRSDKVLAKYLTWRAMEAYLKTWSAVHNYQAKYPEDKERAGRGAEGDIVDRFVATLRAKLPAYQEGIQIWWPLFLVVVKKRV